VLAGAAGGALYYRHSSNTNKENDPATKNGIDYTPATKADNEATNNRKINSPDKPTLDSPTPAPTPAGTPAAINVQITGANVNGSNVHVGTLVGGTAEGDCILSASKPGSAEIQLAQSKVVRDVNTISCGAYNVPTSKFSSGKWQLKLQVTNGSSKGTETYEITVP
jgi:hypothetical protein